MTKLRRAVPPIGSAGRRLLVEQGSTVVWSTDRRLRLTGLQGAADPAPETIEELFPAGGESARGAHEAALAGDAVALRAVVAGRLSDVRLEPLPRRWGRPAGVVGMAVAAAGKDADTTQRLVDLLEHIPAAVYTKPVFPWGRYETMSPTIAAILGYPAEEWLRDETLLDRAIHTDDYVGVRVASQRLRTTGEPLLHEYRMIGADGRVVQIKDAAVYVRGSGGRPDFIQGVVLEAAGRRAAEERLGALRSAEMMGRFATAIVHDFRNSLAAISGYAALLERELERDPQLRPWASEIVRAAERATDFTSRLIAFNRGSASTPQRLDLRTSVEDFTRMFRPLAGSTVEIGIELPGEPVEVVVDPVELDRVLMNLSTNAWDAMPDGGTLTFAMSVVTEGPGGPRVRIAIADTGAGLDEDALRRIFDPCLSTKAFGAGPGLDAVREMVRGWGGEIAVTSTPDVGTRFEITLPQAPAPSGSGKGSSGPQLHAASALPVSRPRFVAL